MKAKRQVLVGLGLDSDGHKRTTTGKNFTVIGGSKDTHEQMTEKMVKINEKLKGKPLELVSDREFDDVAREVGLVKPED